MPYDEASLRHTAERVRIVQDFLGERILLENPSTYLAFERSSMHEAAYLSALAREADCGLLLDVNNVYVSAFNHGWDPLAYLDQLPYDRIAQVHVSGHTHHGTHIIDTHVGPVPDVVWGLWREALRRMPHGVSVLLEWDSDIPPFERVHEDALRAREWRTQAAAERAPETACEARS
jgi:uncharacterized protein (UPF0276 family)